MNMARFAIVRYALPMMLVFLVLVICGSGVQAQVQSQVNSGLLVRLGEKAVKLATELFGDQLIKEVQKSKIPDQSGSKALAIGDVNYEVTKVKVTNFIEPSSNVVLNPGVITLTLTNASISMAGSWKYKYTFFLIKTGATGSFNGSVNNASVTLSMSLGIDGKGRPTISIIGCNGSISSVSLALNGGSDWKVNLFRENIESSIQNLLLSKLCVVATRLTNVRANDLLGSFPLQKAIANDYLLDNRFLAAPEIRSGFVDAKLKGTFYYKGDATEPPMQADPFPAKATTTSDKDLAIWISDYVPKTFAYALYRLNRLRYNMTQRVLPDEFTNVLNTSCSGPYCVGSALPMLAKQYANASVEVELVASKAPTTSISSSGIVVTAYGIATFRARLPAGSLVEIVTINVTLNIFVTVTFNSTHIKSSVTKIVPTVAVLKSAMGSISPDLFIRNIELLGKLLVIPQLNKIIGNGIQLPLPLNFQLKDTEMELENHCLRIAANVERKP